MRKLENQVYPVCVACSNIDVDFRGDAGDTSPLIKTLNGQMTKRHFHNKWMQKRHKLMHKN